MVPLLVPEEEWAPRSWGVNHPLYVARADRARARGGRLRLLGLLALEQPRRRLPRVRRRPDRPRAERLRLRPGAHARRLRLRGLPPGAPAPAAYGRGVVTPHASFLALDFARGAALDEPRASCGANFDAYGTGGFYDASTSSPARSRASTSRSTRGWSWPRSRTSSTGDRLQAYFAQRGRGASIRPLIALEEFTAGREAGERAGRLGGPRSGGGARARARPPRCRRPAALRAESGAGQVTLRWEPVAGAIGYLVHRAPSRRRARGRRSTTAAATCSPCPGPATRHDRHARRAVLVRGRLARGGRGGARRAVRARRARPPLARAAAPLRARVRADRRGGPPRPGLADDRLRARSRSSLADERDRRPGRSAREFDEALRLAHEELGADRVRAHAILHDDLGVYREEDGEPRYDFSRVDARLRPRARARAAAGRRALVHAARPRRGSRRRRSSSTAGLISPPRDWDRWAELNRRLADHLVDRYGLEEVCALGLRDLERGQPRGLLDRDAGGVLPALRRRGPGDQVGRRAAARRRPVDGRRRLDRRLPRLRASSTSVAARLPLHPHVREPPARRARGARGARASRASRSGGPSGASTPTHFNPVSDARVRRAVRAARDEERAGPRRRRSPTGSSATTSRSSAGRRALLHGGFGLLTVGNLRKPRWWALALAEELGDRARRSSSCDGRRRRLARRRLGEPRRRRHRAAPALERHPRPGARSAATRCSTARCTSRSTGSLTATTRSSSREST